MIKQHTKLLWQDWIEVTTERCHLHFQLEQNDLEFHLKTCFRVGDHTAERISQDILITPKLILDIGSSVGFNCLGMAKKYKNAIIVGIEPDEEACHIANSMAQDLDYKNVRFITGFAEELPFKDNIFDLIICHTVIEHVKNVDKCINEMARALKLKGCLHIEAPNYIWPWEPHLKIITLPLCPKPLMRFLAKLQKVGDKVSYLEHLQPVNPIWLENLFRKNNLKWHNRSKVKYLLATSGETKDMAAYRNSTISYKIFSLFKLLRIAKPLTKLALRINFYPSILYTVKK